MTWLQKRLDKLSYTHEDFRCILEKKGIKRVRATITGWTNGKPIKCLSDPSKAKIFAKALKWNLFELFVAANYDFKVPKELVPLIKHYNNLPSSHLEIAIKSHALRLHHTS